MNRALKFFVVSFLLIGIGSPGHSQDMGEPAAPVSVERDFQSFVALFPPLDLPIEVGDGKTKLEDCPLLPRDHRLRNYGECYDYRAIGRVDLNSEGIYLIYYHWCDSLRPTPFYYMQTYSPSGKLLTTNQLASVTYYENSWSVIGADRVLTKFRKAKAKKQVQYHAYSFETIPTGKMIFCSDGWCKVK